MRNLKFYYKNNFCQSSLLKSLEIRLFYRKLNSRKRGNSLSVFQRNSPKYSNDQRGNLIEIDSNFTAARETQDYAPLQRQATTKQTLTTSKHSIEFTYSDFPCHSKANRDKLALTNRKRTCNKGKRLTITVNF